MARSQRSTHSDNDTIVAVITPPGEGGIAALRLAGPQSREYLARFFRPSHSENAEPAPFLLRYGRFIAADGVFLDEVTAVFMPYGMSYTGLEQVEIFCHGGRQVVRLILDQLVAAGARMAEPGEFTKLAFLNGRIDLAKAEAVAELIAANTQSSYEASREHLTGAYSEHVTRIRDEIVSVISEIEAAIDFPEDEITPAGRTELLDKLESAHSQIKKLVSSYATGRLIREGLRVVIAGRPNAGKSSLFNLLLKHERALVNPVPGTTRDYLSEWIDIDGVAVNLIDTAGIRERGGKVERMGQERAKAIMKSADLVIWIVDIAAANWRTYLSRDLASLVRDRILLVGNKLDILRAATKRSLVDAPDMLRISCRTGAGVEPFEKALSAKIQSNVRDLTSGLVVTSARHKQKLSVAQKAIHTAHAKLDSNESLDLVAFDLKQAANAIDEIIGRVYTEQILEQIFGRFCIGK
ncbi:tRNA uridine-5-carboxymethylaminomethyl(34) synthesis GTPase MnmE [candidate division GN15 bacterium]|uniref:tRNA modification GTPase MnmE n=1 Tax=candidate division GN15 bacterium TaxID=2072418 RepID=A0A855X3H2_9BACT|nr:MAG: tRNA uridine-5-carboxymethylaminomethyl(34) synthesis GTPase MnmE [candidate division GN15 bacterium]